jgi:hypothetical protein
MQYLSNSIIYTIPVKIVSRILFYTNTMLKLSSFAAE